jgi:hypothetical protein
MSSAEVRPVLGRGLFQAKLEEIAELFAGVAAGGKRPARLDDLIGELLSGASQEWHKTSGTEPYFDDHVPQNVKSMSVLGVDPNDTENFDESFLEDSDHECQGPTSQGRALVADGTVIFVFIRYQRRLSTCFSKIAGERRIMFNALIITKAYKFLMFAMRGGCTFTRNRGYGFVILGGEIYCRFCVFYPFYSAPDNCPFLFVFHSCVSA